MPITTKTKTVVIANTHLKAGAKFETVRTAQAALLLEYLHKFMSDRHGPFQTPFIVSEYHFSISALYNKS